LRVQLVYTPFGLMLTKTCNLCVILQCLEVRVIDLLVLLPDHPHSCVASFEMLIWVVDLLQTLR
jgi:hypothetical protein